MGDEPARKYDQGKLRYALIPPHPLRLLAFVYTNGANKYGDHNYLNGNGLSRNRIVDAMKRHFESYLLGEQYDEDGQHNLAAVTWGCFTLIMYDLLGLGADDTVGTIVTQEDMWKWENNKWEPK